MKKFRWVTWGRIKDKRVMMLGKLHSHPVLDGEGHIAMFIAERHEPLPFPMAPEEILTWAGKSKQTSLNTWAEQTVELNRKGA